MLWVGETLPRLPYWLSQTMLLCSCTFADGRESSSPCTALPAIVTLRISATAVSSWKNSSELPAADSWLPATRLPTIAK